MGVEDGLTVRWYLQRHRDDGEYLDFSFDGLNVTVRAGGPGAPETVEFSEYESFEAARAAVMERIRPLLWDGWEARLPPEERYQPDPRVAAWWVDGFGVAIGVDEGREPTALLASQVRVPGELREFARLRNGLDGPRRLGGWILSPDDSKFVDGEDAFAELLAGDGESELGVGLLQAFAAYALLGRSERGDLYFAHTNQQDPDHAEVVFWSAERAQVDRVAADSIATWAWAAVASEEGRPDRLEHVAERVGTVPPLSEALEKHGLVGTYESRSQAVYYFWRSIWLVELLRGRLDVSEIDDLFLPDIHVPLAFEDAERSHHLATSPVTALYWMWRLWWFDREAELDRCLRTVAEHPSAVVRSAARFLESIDSSAPGLLERRAQWLALGRDPDAAGRRAVGAIDAVHAARREQEELAAELEIAHDLVARHEAAALREMLPDFADRPAIRDVIEEHLRNR